MKKKLVYSILGILYILGIHLILGQINYDKIVHIEENLFKLKYENKSSEWKELAELTEKKLKEFKPTTEVAQTLQNRAKNRYYDILAYDHSRVKIVTVDSDESTDYINANYIPGQKKYIATQGPLDNTIEDFWKMILEQHTTLIVMLTQVKERDGQEKCEIYWPDKLNSTLIIGRMSLTLLDQNQTPNYILRDIQIKTNGVDSFVRHCQYLTWPDRDCPKADQFYEFLTTVRKFENNGSIVVHCSAGVGRTGTYIAIDSLLENAMKKKPIDVLNKVLEMRRSRVMMVQNQSQYRFIYEMLVFALGKLL